MSDQSSYLFTDNIKKGEEFCVNSDKCKLILRKRIKNNGTSYIEATVYSLQKGQIIKWSGYEYISHEKDEKPMPYFYVEGVGRGEFYPSGNNGKIKKELLLKTKKRVVWL